jgi:hypothetical protein
MRRSTGDPAPPRQTPARARYAEPMRGRCAIATDRATLDAMSPIDDLAAEWEDQWLPSLRSQVHDLYLRKEVHDQLMEALARQGESDSLLADAVHRMYLDSQLMAIRRQADNDRRTLSLHRLFGQLEEAAGQFSRQWWVDRWLNQAPIHSDEEREFHAGMAEAAFDDFCDNPGDAVLGKERLHQDRDRLRAMTDRVVAYVNDYIAHTNRHPGPAAVTYHEFEAAIVHLGEMLQRYFLLLNQAALVSPAPIVQGDVLGPLRRGLV